MAQWITKKYNADLSKVAQRYHISEIVADVLIKRGLFDWTKMDQYLFPEMDVMYPPQRMKGLDKAVDLLVESIQKNRKMKIIGDYDVDGVMSTYLFYEGLSALEGQVSYRIPHRVKDGYGMRAYMAQEAKEEGCDVILTCDNGISAVDAIACAKELNMTVILTDHHEVPKEGEQEILPDADVIVNPKQKDCTYPDKNLCGAGIVYKILVRLYEKMGRTKEVTNLLPFAAIATVCDVVPLLNENRILVKNGLDLLKDTKNIGLKALLNALELKRKISSTDFGFRIGPCINAAGRLKDATMGMELLLEQDVNEAQKKALELVALNEERKEYTALATQSAKEQIKEQKLLEKDKVLVVCVEDCHESVAGIVAGRIREEYYRPTLIITKSEKGLKGSARSIPGYHMQRELSGCRELLTEFGGHAMAVGFSLTEENFMALREQLNRNCTLQESDLVEKIYFDREVPLEEMTEPVVEQLEYMEPFGEGNPAAIFAKREVAVTLVKLCGKEEQIGRLRLKDGIRLYHGVDFQVKLHLKPVMEERYGKQAWEELLAGSGEYKIDILYQPMINERFGGVEFRVLDCR